MPGLYESIRKLEQSGQLKRITYPVDPDQELGIIQRRAFQAGSPALLFTNPKNSSFPILANLYGTRKRLDILFGKNIAKLQRLFEIASNTRSLKKFPNIFKLLPAAFSLWSTKPKKKRRLLKSIPVLNNACTLAALPRLVSWPGDSGAFITLPVVQSQHPDSGSPNWGMYRIQITGNQYAANEAGMHYQLHRGLGIHHSAALDKHARLPVHVYVGGPPALAIAAVMPLPEGMDELWLASLLEGHRISITKTDNFLLPIVNEADFLLTGYIDSKTKPEGPFGDHLGYYSLQHDFPVLTVEKVFHRDNAIWPVTTVGRPPQEDTVFGDFIHELTGSLTSKVFPGVSQIHAVDAAGVHPLLLAVGSERYQPFSGDKKSLELVTQGLHLLGATQTSLAKYVLIQDNQNGFQTDAKAVREFIKSLLERTDFERDLHFITSASQDTLDYTGSGFNEGSKLIWTATGTRKRKLGLEISGDFKLGGDYRKPTLIQPGILAIQGRKHLLKRHERDPGIDSGLCQMLSAWPESSSFPLIVLVDDVRFTGESFENFLWTTFTRSDPARDVYGVKSSYTCKHWRCAGPIIIDARIKPWHPPMLEENPEIVKKVEALAVRGGPLNGLI